MWVIKPATVRAWAEMNRDVGTALLRWLWIVDKAEWSSLHDVRRDFRSADEVRVASGSRVVVFNIGGNKYRLIAAIHYNVRRVFVLRLLTHAEYDTNRWKDAL